MASTAGPKTRHITCFWRCRRSNCSPRSSTSSQKKPVPERGDDVGPNRAAAICLANSSAAWLLEGKATEASVPGAILKGAELALADAEKSTEADPEYLKGHRRQIAALQTLGRTAEIIQKREELAVYDNARSVFPAESLALCQAGWLEYMRGQLVYNAVRFDECLTYLRSGPLAQNPKVEIRPSIVPYQEGQCLMMSLCYGYPTGQIIECLDWIQLDPENGDMADAPPMGHASELSLKRTPLRLGSFIEDLQARGCEVTSCMLGQGLTEHVSLIESALKEGCILEQGGEIARAGPFPNVLVYRAASTAASEDNGVPSKPDINRNCEALMRRRQGGTVNGTGRALPGT